MYLSLTLKLSRFTTHQQLFQHYHCYKLLQSSNSLIVHFQGLFFIMGGLYPFIVILDTIAKFSAERAIFFREMEDGLYTTGPYFFSKVLSTLPFHSVFLVLYTVPMYWLAGLQPTVRIRNSTLCVVCTLYIISCNI